MPKAGTGIWRENRKSWKTKNTHCRTWIMARKLKKSGKWHRNTVRPAIWQGTLKKLEREKCTLYDLECGKKTKNYGKCEKHAVGREIWRNPL